MKVKKILNKKRRKTVFVEDKKGWSRWQLWCLMAEFGDHLYHGCVPPFDPDIKIIKTTI